MMSCYLVTWFRNIMYCTFVLICEMETGIETTNANWKQVSDNFYILKN